MKRFSQEEMTRSLANAKASLQIEGYELSPEEEQLILARINGELSHEDFLARVKEIATNA